jgi:hypothetical protein
MQFGTEHAACLMTMRNLLLEFNIYILVTDRSHVLFVLLA